MDPNIFKKEDAESCLVVNKTWDQILNKPDFFTELGQRIVNMTEEAEKVGELTRESTLKFVKAAINKVLLGPLGSLHEEIDDSAEKPSRSSSDSIMADAFWDEISQDDKVYENLKSGIEKAYAMKKRINAMSPLSDAASLQDTKNTMNKAILEPLRGIFDEE